MKLLLLIASILTMFSCSPEKGCTDITAKNYSSDADIDDGSCIQPTLTDKIIGNWYMTRSRVETKDSAGINLLSINKTSVGSVNYNSNGTALFSEDTSSFFWAVSGNNILISEDSVTHSYNVNISSVTKQDWVVDSSSITDVESYNLYINITLTK